MSLRSILLSILTLLALACGGGGKTTYPGPESIVLTVEEPLEGAVSASPSLTLYGRVSQKDAFVACNEQPVFVDASGLFQAVVQLKPGDNQVILKAWGAEEAKKGRGSSLLPLGQVATTLIRKVVYRGPSLTLKVNTPVEGARFTAPRIAVSGSVSDAATVTLNGNPLGVAESGSFQGTVDLQPGANALVFLASASGGRSATETRNVVYEPPVAGALQVLITAPAEGLLTNAPAVEVTGTLSDPTASLTLNGQAVTPKGDGTWSLTLTPPEGTVTLVATATKGATTAQDQRGILVDRTPPVITLSAPVPASVASPALSLVGTVDDPTASLSLAGQGLSLGATGGFATQVALGEGANTLHFRAVDPAGNVGTLDVPTTYARTGAAPVVLIDSPLDGFTTVGSSVLVKGHVDDPTATLLLQGEQTPIDPLGNFERLLSASKMGVMAVRAEATNSHGTGKAGIYVTFDEKAPVLAWADPTPAAGSRLTSSQVSAAVLINKAALTTINGERTELEPSGDPAMPFKAKADLSLQEGQVVLTAIAVDAAGNEATLTRELELGLTAPSIVVEAPAFDANGRFSTVNPGATLTGRVEAPDAVKPLTLTLNGAAVSLTAEGRFSIPMSLVLGDNPARLVAANRFQQTSSRSLVVVRTSGTPEPGQDTTPGIRIDWPQNGFASGTAQVAVKGRVLVPGMSATLNGANVAVDPQTLVFTGTVSLNPGDNLIQATGTDAQGRVATDQVQGRYITKDAVHYTWLTPLGGARSKTRTVAITGKADQPGVLSITVNDTPMALDPVTGAFTGQVSLAAKGKNALLLQATTLGGEALAPERREVIFQPELPSLRLVAPESARPGTTVSLQVLPETGTTLVSADLSFDGRLLAHLASPFPAQQVAIPGDAVVGSKLVVEAVGTDAEGETVTARAYLTIYDTGALLQKVLDDRSGLPLQGASVAIEGGESGLSDASGRVALATALPANWIKVSKEGSTPVWRSAALKRSGVEASLDARLTALEVSATLPASFGKGAISLQGAGAASATPLSSQGLPGLLPAGWSAVSAWWMVVEGPATAKLKLDASLPSGGTYVWARWDEIQHLWIAQAPAPDLAALAVPQSGGYTLLMPDPDPTAPPAAVAGQALQAFQGNAWSEGFTFDTGKGPGIMSTADAINGARMEAFLGIAFNGKAPVPSGTVIQADLLESYTLIDAQVIEPESYTQDLLAYRWALTVVDGAPALQSATDGLLLKQPVRMSRSFQASELVQGSLRVGYYHDGVRVADTGSGLLDASGGSLTHEGITVNLPAGAVSGSALVRILPDTGDLAALWPELAGKGSLKHSFQIDVVSTLLKGMGLSLAALDAPEGARPLVLQRRVVQGQRLVVAVGELTKTGSTWNLVTPTGGNPVMEGGSFAILVPTEAWDWISGTATMPEAAAASLIQKRGAKAGMKAMTNASIPVNPRPSPAIPSLSLSSSSAPSVSVSDVKVDAGYLLATSGTHGTFAVPSLTSAAPATVNGSRWDLGLTGTLSAPVPSASNSLVLATVPFVVETLLPSPGSPIPPATAFQVLTTGPIDPNSLVNARILTNGSEVALRRSLNQDGRILLLAPEQPLVLGQSYQLVIDGLTALSGDTAPKVDQTYQVQAPAAALSPVDFSRIKLSYPDASFNVTVTIPQSAIPARTKVEVEAPGMGSVGTATMPDSGEQSFTLKASLGERLSIKAELPSGQVVTGYLSRYEAGDGTGRVTLGVDGGRIEAIDGSGAAVNLPVGAIDRPVEFTLECPTGVPSDLNPELAVQEKIVGRLELRTQEPVTLNKRPVVEIRSPDNPSQVKHPDGLGSYAVFYSVEGFEEDGTPVVYYELNDTAAVDGTVLKSYGGLPEALSLSGDTSLARTRLISELQEPKGSYFVARNARVGGASAALAGPIRGGKSFMSAWLLGYVGMSILICDAGPHYMGGFADIDISGVPEILDAEGAFIYFSKNLSTLKRAGNMLGRTNSAGCYLFASFLTNEAIRDGGLVMGVDKDYGVRATSPAIPLPPTISGTYIHVPTLHFVVPPVKLEDHQAPSLSARFVIQTENGAFVDAGAFLSTQSAKSLWIEVTAGDNKDGDSFAGGKNAKGELTCQVGSAVTLTKISTGKWRAKLDLPVGHHTASVYARDNSGNETRTAREIDILEFKTEAPAAGAPEAEVYLEPDAEKASVDRPIRIVFSRDVTIPGASSIALSTATGESASFTLVGSSGVLNGTTVVRVLYVMPSPALAFGTSYLLTLGDDIKSAGEEKLGLQHQSYSFTTTQVRNAQTWNLAFKPGKTTGLGNRLFVLDAQAQLIKAVTVASSGDPKVEDVKISTLSDYYGQDVVGMKAFSCVPVNGARMDLLLVTTSPRVGDDTHQSVLWAFRAYGDHSLLFAVSIGSGSSGYSPTLDCRDGVIAVGRLSNSVLLIDASKAKTGWDNWKKSGDERGVGGSGPGETGMVRSSRGVNAQAIIQPFYFTDPEGTLVPSHWGVALVPNLAQGASSSELDVVVGLGAAGVMWSPTEPLAGMPSYQYSYNPGVEQGVRLPYDEDPAHPGANKNVWPGAVRKPGTSGGQGFGAKKLTSWVRANVAGDDGAVRTANLVVGVSGMSVLAETTGNSLVVMDDTDPTQGRQLGVWPSSGATPFGTGVAFEIVHQDPLIDPATGYCAVRVLKTSTQESAWFIIDLNKPTSPKTLAKLTGGWSWGTMGEGCYLGIKSVGEGKGAVGLIRVSSALGSQQICSDDLGIGFNVTAFVDYMNSHAHAVSRGACARYVRQGLEAAGFNTTGRPRWAGNYGPFLTGLGFQVVQGADGSNPLPGDIAVFDINDYHEYGHIQMWNGNQWVSDFFQNQFIPYRSNVPNYTVYRYRR